MNQVQGSKFDPEGDYVRLWLPELARLPTEWIHHPWDAPPALLRAAGVELGVNYPKPIIEIDTARDRLRDAIFVMQEKAGTGTDGNENGTNEEVFDNSDNVGTSGTPKVVLKGKNVSTSVSSRDQRVPSMQNMNNLNSRKRAKPTNEENNNNNDPPGCKMDMSEEDLVSTADSSSNKKPTTSRTSFCVPQTCSVSSFSKPDASHDFSDLKHSWHKNTETEEESSGKDGK